MSTLRRLLPAAAVLALLVVTVGAYTRLKDAGLGCPDWPGCYGQLIGVPAADDAGTPIDQTKAWIEVGHRYVAAFLGLAILAIAFLAWRNPAAARLRWPAAALAVLVLLQGGLGALTVTELLQPAIVVAHLLGGMAILSLLVALAVQALELRLAVPAAARRAVAGFMLLLFVQVALGGWVSANYAGLACGTQFPACGGSWTVELDGSGFALDRELGQDAAGAPLTQRAKMAIQWVHRLGAYAIALAAIALGLLLLRRGIKIAAAILLLLLLSQFSLGIYIVMKGLPLASSLLHNTGAALLLAWCAALLPAMAPRDSA